MRGSWGVYKCDGEDEVGAVTKWGEDINSRDQVGARLDGCRRLATMTAVIVETF